MTTKCYHCETHAESLPNQVNGDPLGVCLRCHVMACRGHAVRDPHYPRWICVVCVPNLLSASAARVEGSTSVLALLFSSALLQDEGLFPNLDAFIETYPEMQWVHEDLEGVLDAVTFRLRGTRTGAMWELLTPEGRRMVAAAIVIVRRLRIDPRELVEGLRIFVEESRYVR